MLFIVPFTQTSCFFVHAYMALTPALTEVLRQTLEDLNEKNFNKFKKYLADNSEIPRGHLDNANTDDTVDLVVETHAEDAGVIVMSVLKKIRHNRMAKDLKRNLGECKYVTLHCI
ncbi:hypothetical protein ACEWY4_001719 [Coilia grayii]|uniref:Pyrin domain-containing protein n=1 Tax=Coilia grayii TaxID=363190 RepID=A0ABD1KTS3_9TELE